ncbi:unnamed protein product [Owenia fusiformis]|uniref:ubiquitinyl hydrolase 1 n=1 Tax=Owenia fusiformis TaxID=6347 RepID=A0A8J1TQX7_OWEFU|nr:unnamed protein product [Owenia fusiformis]
MPGVKKKDLYLAKDITSLNKYCEVGSQKITSARLGVKSADKLFKNGQESDMLGDEERAYVLFMRYFDCIQNIKKTADYKKNEQYYRDLMGTKNLLKAMDEAERLQESLKKRYEEREAEEIVKKLDALDMQQEENSKKQQEQDAIEAEKIKAAEIIIQDKVTAEAGVITPQQLYTLLTDGTTSLLVIDTRSEKEFQESHLNIEQCISIPSDIIPSGTTVTYIEKALPTASKVLWDLRDQVDQIVLMDWKSAAKGLSTGSVLKTLKDALYKFDASKCIKVEPCVLDGGYDNWLLYYPTMTTNANIPRPPSYSDAVSPIPSLDFDYPDFDTAFMETPKPEVKPPPQPTKPATIENITTPSNLILNNTALNNSKPNNVISNTTAQVTVKHIPTVNRSLKPQEAQASKPMNAQPTNNSTRTSDLESLRKELRTDDKNIMEGNESEMKTQVKARPNMPDRSSKPSDVPKDIINDLSSKKVLNTEVTRELIEAQETRKTKEEELLDYKTAGNIADTTHQMTLSRLQEDQKRADEMQRRSKEEAKNYADLLRKKRQIEEEIKVEKEKWETEKQKRQEEEAKRLAEIERLRKLEEEKREAQTEVDQLRIERKRKENEGRKKQEELDQAKLIAAQEAASEKAKEAERQKMEEDLKTQLKLEQERKIQQQKLIDESIRLQEKLKAEKEANERKRREEEDKRIAKEKSDKEKQDRLRKVEPEIKLPTGWERKWDEKSQKYFFVNHTKGTTQWEPPSISTTVNKPVPSITKTRLRDENDTPRKGSNLARSHSSPNIAQMLEDEALHKPIPKFERFSKPTEEKPKMTRQQPIVSLNSARVRNLQPTYGSTGRGLTGLRNMGNTCYMSTCIQCLSNTPALTAYFLADYYKEDINRENKLSKNGELAEEYGVLCKALWQGQYRSITPIDFKCTVDKYFQPLFGGFSQQDSQELLVFLLDGIHEDCNRVKNRPQAKEDDFSGQPDHTAAEKAWQVHKQFNQSIMVELFQGQLKSTLTCLTCGKTSVKFDVFMYITLPVPTSRSCSLQDCFKLFLKEEKMTGDSRWNCPRCKCKRDAIKKIDIWKTPPVLIICLKRFWFDSHQFRQKITTTVDFPLRDMSLNGIIQGPKRTKPYNLYAVSNHYGTMEGGHYTAFSRNSLTERWHRFDDHMVSDMSEREVKTSAAYILFYNVPMEVRF